jgi:hypothetical protein
MTNQHPITPPPELVKQWIENWYRSKVKHTEIYSFLAACGAQWGADQELEACCHEVQNMYSGGSRLRAARRPKPPSLKEQALEELNLTADPNGAELSRTQVDLIRRALESIND